MQWLYLAGLTADVMIVVGLGVHLGERLIDRALGISHIDTNKPTVKEIRHE
jgi:hypothetical protein